MGAEFLSDETSSPEMDVGEFLTKQAPQYYAIGVTPDQYWRGDPLRLPELAEAHKIKLGLDNTKLWLQGKYFDYAIRTALASAFGSPQEYLDAPFPLSEMEREEQEENRARQKYEQMRQKFMAESQVEKGRQVNE